MSIKKRPSRVLKAAKSVFKSYNGTRLFYLGFFYFSSCGSLNAPFLVGIFVYLLAVVGTPICVWAGTSLDFPDPLPTVHRLGANHNHILLQILLNLDNLGRLYKPPSGHIWSL